MDMGERAKKCWTIHLEKRTDNEYLLHFKGVKGGIAIALIVLNLLFFWITYLG